MIENGELKARINEKLKTVRFISEESDSNELEQKVVEQTGKIREIMSILRSLGDDIVVSSDYQKKLIKKSTHNYDIDD